MGATRFSQKEQLRLLELRQRGFSIHEISRLLNRSKATVAKRVAGIEIMPEFLGGWKSKRGGSSLYSHQRKALSLNNAKSLIGPLRKRDMLLIAACLYWGEGNKRDFSFINSDPNMIQTLLDCLMGLGVEKSRLKVGIRIYEDIDPSVAKEYWSNITTVPKEDITSVNIIIGKRAGKLPNGMCRIRIARGNDYFNLLTSTVKLISKISPHSSTDRATDS